MELACELNDNDPWTLLSSAHYSRFLRIDRAGSAARRVSRWPFRRRPPISNGAITASFASCAATMPAPSRPAIAPMMSYRSLPAWRAAALFELGAAARRRARRRSAFSTEFARSGLEQSAPTDEAITRWLLQAHPISVRARWETLRRRLARRRASGRRHSSSCPGELDCSGADADRVVADTFGMHLELLASGITGSMPLNRRL